MKEIVNVKPVKIDYKCPKCNIGYLRPNGIISHYGELNQPHHQHNCNNPICDYVETFNIYYPYIDYIPADVEFPTEEVIQKYVDLKYPENTKDFFSLHDSFWCEGFSEGINFIKKYINNYK